MKTFGWLCLVLGLALMILDIAIVLSFLLWPQWWLE